MGEENERNSTLRDWAIIIAFSAFLIAWGLVQFYLIPDAPRTFDYGALEDVPGQSPYSIEPSKEGTTVPRQLPQLPEAVPVKGAKKPGDAPSEGGAP